MKILDYMKNNFLFLDGGMGTLLQESGLKPGELPERMNITSPDVIRNIHRSYYDAGSNVILCNTFGANSFKFDDRELEEVISAAIENGNAAREMSKTDHEKYIALDIGPLGRLLKPYGDLDFEEAVSLYSKIVKIGAKYNPDLIFIETMNDSYDTKAALLAAKENSSLPVFVSNAYGSDGKLMTGANPKAMVAMLEGMHADAIGANCSLGPKQLIGVMEEYLKFASVPVLIKPNAGLPRNDHGKTVYDVYPDEFSDDIKNLLTMGVRIAGGCCGTRPEYIKAVCKKATGLTPVPVTEKNISMISSYTHAVEFKNDPILIGERINPTGKKLFKQALRDNDIDYILGEGLKQEDAGVQVLDVNVGLPEIDEEKMLVTVVEELQAVSDLPLQLDTTDFKAMESALRRYNGKAMVNSVNGKNEVMENVFPLVKKYGGFVVCLTLDEDGIPESSAKRVAIAKRIIDKAKEYGIEKRDLIFDPLAMTISADTTAALSTLDAVYQITTELEANTSLGVSNVSFGLPERNLVTSVFFSCALEKGLSAAIMNPYSLEMMNVYFAFRALHNLDANCGEYINHASSLPKQIAVSNSLTQANTNSDTKSSLPSEKDVSPLKGAIMRGLKEKASAITKELLNEVEPLSIVNEEIIPALDVVGKGFEKKEVFLPQLLMAAEASKASFEEIKKKMAESDTGNTAKRMTFIIATVHGDIHDIGKNIVKLILENYGFDVYDLGKDVPEQTIVDKAIELHAPAVGLSALMTTTVPAMENTIKLLREQAPWVKVCVGGAVMTQEYSDQIGADRYCKDAMDTVRYAEELESALSKSL
ncbi:MAG: homocysteine S-methyltransferase family protein [Lachnospiraceae bacterium]|nr:homocysteine S-methyltransferase family protein [Lachnospiraceae bacterium]